ncbi:uncharacterized protein LOC122859348 [Aphidius gifuensis]|uniref:uncharacterized protein LOC122859348 n=1 Tax=Aphidius gifuensis TaxID=684658 RepID=UPI001CDCB22A|nr:uncharacterized protein LOC122859348 [Aphidius gifuensis]
MSQYRRISRSHGGLTLCILYYCLLSTISQVYTENRVLSRRKRYVVFPEGSSFSIALCMTMKTLSADPIFTEGVNWGISYDLPNETKAELKPFLQLRKDKIKPISGKYQYQDKINHELMNKNLFKYDNWNKVDKNYYYDNSKQYYYNKKTNNDYIKRRHRRDLYNKLEVIMNAMGFNGRSCILRALCEASQRLMPKGNTLVEEMMRIAFSLPLRRVLMSDEPEEHHTYTQAHRSGNKGARCDVIFGECPFSLIDMALGKYSVEPNYGLPKTQVSDIVPNVNQDVAGYSLSHFAMK